MKKNIRLCLILLCLTLLVSLTGLAQTEETIYYAAPHDTASYHVDPACPLIPSQDRDSLLTLTPVSQLSMAAAIGVAVALFGVLLVSMAAGGELALSLPARSEPTGPTQEQKLDAYCARCAFTPREREVFEKLMTTEDDLQCIADSLYISRRMVQRYVTSIYEKTETKTRLGLFQRYMNFSKD